MVKPKKASAKKVKAEGSTVAEIASDPAMAEATVEAAPIKKPRAKKAKAEG